MEEVKQAPKPDVEEALCVLRAYGSSTYELEETLYHKYLMVCATMKKSKEEELARDKFHFLLDQLSSQGYLKLISRGDKLYWMRLRSPLELEEGGELTPEKASRIIEEARAKRETAEDERKAEKKEEGRPIQKPSVGEMADVILSELLRGYDPEKLRSYVAKGEAGDVRSSIKELHEALIDGVDEFRLYVERSTAPRLKGRLIYFLATAGRDALLAALAVSLRIPLNVAVSSRERTAPT